jgi:hypothetical protein
VAKWSRKDPMGIKNGMKMPGKTITKNIWILDWSGLQITKMCPKVECSVFRPYCYNWTCSRDNQTPFCWI